MCMQCVRADRREAEGRPSQWQRRQAGVLFVDFQLDTSAPERAFREFGLVAERTGTVMREVGDTLTVTYPTDPTPAQLERAVDMTQFIVPGSLRFGRGA